MTIRIPSLGSLGDTSACTSNPCSFGDTFPFFGLAPGPFASTACINWFACMATNGSLSNDPTQVSLTTYLPYILGAAIFFGVMTLVGGSKGR